MASSPQEWMRQADYDLETAEAMFDSGRYFYAAFMCHLSVEKALKGSYMAHRRQLPPKTHDLGFLAKALPLALSEERKQFLLDLTGASVATRYPEEMDSLIAEFPKAKTRKMLTEGRKIVKWLSTELTKSQAS